MFRRLGCRHVFDDEYLSSGGQLHELMTGHDRFVADLRPLIPGFRSRAPIRHLHISVAGGGRGCGHRPVGDDQLDSPLEHRQPSGLGRVRQRGLGSNGSDRSSGNWWMSSGLGRAPGRLDLMGGVADYSGALVLQIPTRRVRWWPSQTTRSLSVQLLSSRPTSSKRCPAPPIPTSAGPGRNIHDGPCTCSGWYSCSSVTRSSNRLEPDWW